MSETERKKPEKSCGIIAYRFTEPHDFSRLNHGRMEILLGKCGGLSRNMDTPWNIPKGHLEGEEEDRECAIREFHEETGLVVKPTLVLQDLGTAKTSSGKTVHIFGLNYDYAEDGGDVVEIHSNLCKVEIPRKSGNFVEVPELIEAKYMDAEDAIYQIFPYQRIFVKRLLIYHYQTLIRQTANRRGLEPSLAKELNASTYNFEVDEKFDPNKSTCM